MAPASADDLARATAVGLERGLAARAGATLERHPMLKVAAAAAAAHSAHAQALGETLPTSPGTTGSPVQEAPHVPAHPTKAARALAAAERRAAQAHRTTLARTGVTGGLARLLASVAGSDEALALAVQTGAGT